MTTIYRLNKNELIQLTSLLIPEYSSEKLEEYDIDKLRVLISEWLLLHGFSCIHIFPRDNDDKWILPIENECDCCCKYRIGKNVESNFTNFFFILR